MVCVPQEATVKIDTGSGGRETERELNSTLCITELAVNGGKIIEALAKAIHRVRCAPDRGAEASLGDILEDHLHRVYKVDIEGFGVSSLVLAADGTNYGRSVIGFGEESTGE